MFPAYPILLLGLIIVSCFAIRLLNQTAILFILKKWWRSLEERCHAYQFYKVPQFNEHMQENQLYRKVSVYLNSLRTVEDSDFANLFSGNRSHEINLAIDPNHIVIDTFLSARVHWTNQKPERDGSRVLVLRIRRSDKRRILRPYLQHIHTVYDEIEQRAKEVKLYINEVAQAEPERRKGRWRSLPFTHPATIDSVAMESDLKTRVKSDLEAFLKSKQYYHRLGRVWKRSYLLYGPPGTGKSSFVAAMAKFLCYDVYDINLSDVIDDADLKMLLLQTTNKSMIVMEDLDRHLSDKSTAVSLSGVLNFMDGILSCCGEERIMVFTMKGKDRVDPTVLRPGRIDVHVHFPLCDFSAFKTLASSHLGLKEHKLFPQVEEIFQSRRATLSPAEIGEIMISNRSSPSRALKSVITALQNNGDRSESGKVGQCLTYGSTSRRFAEESGESGSFLSRESAHTVKEFRKLYGMLKMGSRRKDSVDMDSADQKESSKQEA